MNTLPALMTDKELADQYAEAKAVASKANKIATAIKNEILSRHLKVVESDQWRLVVTHSNKTTTDWKTIANKLEPSRQMITAHTKKTEVISLRTNSLI